MPTNHPVEALDKDVVRRILAVRYRPESNGAGPSWLTFLGHTKDSLWSCDLFRCVLTDQFTCRIVGFGAHSGVVDGVALCRCSNERSAARLCRNTSARITIRCTDSTSGKPIFESFRRQKSRRFLMCRDPIRSSSARSARFGANSWTGRCFGPARIWRENSSSSTAGRDTVRGCSRLQLRHDLGIRHAHVVSAQKSIIAILSGVAIDKRLLGVSKPVSAYMVRAAGSFRAANLLLPRGVVHINEVIGAERKTAR